MNEYTIHIAIMVRPYATYTYTLPAIYSTLPGFHIEDILGARVAIPLGRRAKPIMGIIVNTDSCELDSSIKVRPISWILDEKSLFSKLYVAMIRELAIRYAVQEGAIYATVIPAPLRSLSTKMRFFGEDIDIISVEDISLLPVERKEQYIMSWWKQQYAYIQHDAREFDVYSLAKEPPWPIKSNAKAQRAILHALWEEGELTRNEIQERSGVRNYATVKQLISAGFIDVEKTTERIDSCVQYTRGSRTEEEVASLTHSLHDTEINQEVFPRKNQNLPPCTPEQERVLHSLYERLGTGSSVELLFGVTGSGKSRIYCELIYRCLQQGKHALILAPEIALVHKLVNDIDLFFENVPYYVYHGYQTPLYKKELFSTIQKSTQPSILIGTRSALFVPYSNVGLCILDEEHDSSYKQDTGMFLYNAKDVAWYVAKSNNAMLLLGSATPDCKTLYSAEQGSIHQHIIHVRATGVEMPTIDFVDMKQEKGLLSTHAIDALQDTLERNEQAIILLNRRGYAPHMYCTACNAVQQCPYCQVSLLYHKAMNILRCSYCGYSEHFPQPCSQCASMQYVTLGFGTEKLEEELQELFPHEEPCIRLDRDNARSPRHIHAILDRFLRGESSILVGTQMLAKGHNFPKVSLSIIVDADNGLHFPDYRAMERVFQLIVQTAGRAGRGTKRGHVIVQTRSIENPCWQFVLHNDYMELYRYEMEIREKRGYPPFIHIAMIRIVCTMSYEEAKQYIRTVMQYIRQEGKSYQCTVLGPVPSPIAIIRGQYRYQMLVKASSWQRIRALYVGIQQQLGKTKGVRITLDIDPVSMM